MNKIKFSQVNTFIILNVRLTNRLDYDKNNILLGYVSYIHKLQSMLRIT